MGYLFYRTELDHSERYISRNLANCCIHNELYKKSATEIEVTEFEPNGDKYQLSLTDPRDKIVL